MSARPPFGEGLFIEPARLNAIRALRAAEVEPACLCFLARAVEITVLLSAPRGAEMAFEMLGLALAAAEQERG